jgi:hypothetical protein
VSNSECVGEQECIHLGVCDCDYECASVCASVCVMVVILFVKPFHVICIPLPTHDQVVQVSETVLWPVSTLFSTALKVQRLLFSSVAP